MSAHHGDTLAFRDKRFLLVEQPLEAYFELIGQRPRLHGGGCADGRGYAARWEIESVFDELKTHQRGPRIVLRSKSPDLVLQEIWGHLCCHYAIRSVMADAAHHGGRDPDRVSFTATLRIVRQSVAQQGAFPPSPATIS